jgi:hypothetical protein
VLVVLVLSVTGDGVRLETVLPPIKTMPSGARGRGLRLAPAVTGGEMVPVPASEERRDGMYDEYGTVQRQYAHGTVLTCGAGAG